MKKVFSILWKVILSFVIFTVLWVCIYLVVDPFITPYQAFNFVKGNGLNKDWVSIDEVSPNFLRAVIASEDALFLEHRGVDWKAVEDAQRYNERNKRGKTRGASTITMQTAKKILFYGIVETL